MYIYRRPRLVAGERAPAVLMNLAPAEFHFIFRPAAAGKNGERGGGPRAGRGGGSEEVYTEKEIDCPL